MTDQPPDFILEEHYRLVDGEYKLILVPTKESVQAREEFFKSKIEPLEQYMANNFGEDYIEIDKLKARIKELEETLVACNTERKELIAKSRR